MPELWRDVFITGMLLNQLRVGPRKQTLSNQYLNDTETMTSLSIYGFLFLSFLRNNRPPLIPLTSDIFHPKAYSEKSQLSASLSFNVFLNFS